MPKCHIGRQPVKPCAETRSLGELVEGAKHLQEYLLGQIRRFRLTGHAYHQAMDLGVTHLVQPPLCIRLAGPSAGEHRVETFVRRDDKRRRQILRCHDATISSPGSASLPQRGSTICVAPTPRATTNRCRSSTTSYCTWALRPKPIVLLRAFGPFARRGAGGDRPGDGKAAPRAGGGCKCGLHPLEFQRRAATRPWRPH